MPVAPKFAKSLLAAIKSAEGMEDVILQKILPLTDLKDTRDVLVGMTNFMYIRHAISAFRKVEAGLANVDQKNRTKARKHCIQSIELVSGWPEFTASAMCELGKAPINASTILGLYTAVYVNEFLSTHA